MHFLSHGPARVLRLASSASDAFDADLFDGALDSVGADPFDGTLNPVGADLTGGGDLASGIVSVL